jgi:Flp pilus assembly protein TadG
MKHSIITKVAAFAKKLKKDTSGVAAIEMAFIFPVMIIFLVGLVDVTDGMSRSRKVTITANTIGDLVTQEPGTTSALSLNGIFNSALETMAPYDGSAVGIAVYNFRLNGGGSPVLEWQRTKGISCGGAPTGSNAMKQLMTQNNDLIITRTCFQFSYILGTLFSSNPSFMMKEEMTLRPRKSLQLECPTC